MEKHITIIKHLEKVENWETEEKFLVDALVLSCAKLFHKSYEELNENSLVTIAPWLRQIHENIVVIIGISEKVYTLEEFVKKGHRPRTIMDRIKKQKYATKEEEFDRFDNYLFGLKKMLNKFSHTNIEGVMTLFTERFQVHESIEFNKIMMKFFITFLEILFIVMVNDLYKLAINVPQPIDLGKELKTIGTLKYVTRHFPDSIKEFISNSETLNDYYTNIIKNLRSTNKDFIEYLNKLNEDIN